MLSATGGIIQAIGSCRDEHHVTDLFSASTMEAEVKSASILRKRHICCPST